MTDTPLIDCDIHCVVPSREALYPYLTEHWRGYMEATHFRPSPAVANTYPAWSHMLETPVLSLEEVQRDVLNNATLAILNCYYGVESYTHPYLASALATAVNRWLQDEWLDGDARLLAGAAVAPAHGTQALAELRRVAEDERFVQLMVPVRSTEPYGDERFWPLWEAAAEAGIVIGIHFGGAAMHPHTMVGYVDTAMDSYVNATNAFQGHIVSLVFSGIFERCPELRFAIVESGWTWLPALMWKMDQEWKAFRREVPWIGEPPSEYVRRHFRFTTQPVDAPPTSAELSDVLSQLGSNELLMYSSDFPHSYETGAERLLGCLDEEQAGHIRWMNAANLYGLQDRVSAGIGS
jgi:uncharacterized protein